MELFVNIDVDNLARAAAFYTTAFDLRVARQLGAEGVELVGGSSKIYLLHRPEHDYRRHWTPVHLDFLVDDVESAVARAVAAGATLERPTTTYDWGTIAGLADPWGHGLCLLRLTPLGYDAISP